ncbi:acyltransferase family protein [Rhizobium tubonense]|uniref:Acyltransferase n=1 Tax=Rhizobium tubonense TaxID=484088 RepID=A0A2W4CYR0_9HYPH|nr:acyltransferase [Rhizobium tubonense]PZM17249.1 acyltransferase [Rhizobium tubonense]
MQTIGAKLAKNKGLGKGFDFLRVFLSLSVLLTHSYLIVLGTDGPFGAGYAKTFHDALIPMFFALSGFLITGSATRLSLSNFLLNRGARIVPALAMDIFISALILGPLLTTVSLSTYFGSYEFRAYFANLLGLIHFILPGVFESNPFPATVNGSLWTIPFELGCYVLMSFMIVSGVISRKWKLLAFAAVIGAIIFGLRMADFNPLTATGIELFNSDGFKTAIHHYTWPLWAHIYVYFLVGCVAFIWKEHIPYSISLFVLALFIVVLSTGDRFGVSTDLTRLVPLVYITVFVGITEIPSVPFFDQGDYSYGIYLYGYPLQQALVYLFPRTFSPISHFLVSGVLVTGVAWMSWHWFEKPILRMRKKFSFTARMTEKEAEPTVAEAPAAKAPRAAAE